MKFLTAIIVTTILSTSLLAGSAKKQGQLASDMRTMLSALVDIQNAGFYNSKEGMIEGIERLKKGLHSLNTTDAKSYLPESQAYADKFAQKRAKMITMYADDLVESLKYDHMEDAQQDYTLIMKQCTSCHLRLRQQIK